MPLYRSAFRVARFVAVSCLLGVNGFVLVTPIRALPPREDGLALDLASVRLLLERSLDWRARTGEFFKSAGKQLENGVLTSADLTRMYRGAEDYVFLRRRWQALIDCQGDEAWKRAAPALAADPAGRTQTKLALAAALMQHDDFMLGVEPFFKVTKSRRLLKADHPDIEGELDAAMRFFLNPVMRARLARIVVWHRAEGGLAADRSADEILLDDIIAQSPGYRFFTRDLAARTLDEWRTGSSAAVTFVTDLADRFGKGFVHTSSLAVGNTVGLVETRKGYLTSLTSAERGAILARLQPLDVLLEKTPFRLTDKSIPGHYGHVAVWVGTEAELRALDVWEHPLVRPHQERIRAGAGIVEALRSGVEINTLEHFLNIDDLLAIRPPARTRDETKAGVLRAFAQIGKEYDFNFDVESDKRIVCSELAFVVFPEEPWQTTRVLGRASISPDQVAIKAIPGGTYVPLVLYYDGVEIVKSLPETVGCLLKEDLVALRALHPEFVGRSARGR